ncbi:Receptor-like serine/threonine-protein kinase At2g45590 [Linum grandiflorum]
MPSRRLLSPPSPSHPLRRHHLPAILAAALGFSLISLFLFLFIFLYRKLSRHRTAPTNSSSDLKSPSHTHQCRHFSYPLLRRATSSFSQSNLLGHGGFGSVYKAVLGGSAAAVKVMDPNGSLQGEREFHNELSIASSLDSPYIVNLLGYSTDRRKRKLILVYELMENRSLQEALMDRKCEELMDWSKRYSVMTDVARGLEYLHHCCNPPVIHGDVKPSNILLDSDFNAKIGDFGLARLKSEEIAECEDNSMRGTVCYIAPEYGGGAAGTEKCDVYSFGVLLLVVVSGRRPLQVTASPMSEFERANLISWARQLAHNGKLLDLVDPLIHSLDKDQALLVITIALLCLQRSPGKRPSVKEIVEMLSGEAEPPNLPFEFSPSPPSNFPFKSRKKVHR